MSEVLSELARDVADLSPGSRVELLEAVAATAMLIARADGTVSLAEMERIARALSTARGAEADRIDRLLEGHWRELESEGVDVLLADLARQMPDPRQRRLALAFAVFVACADGRAEPSEERLLARMGAAFGLPTHEVRRLLVQIAS